MLIKRISVLLMNFTGIWKEVELLIRPLNSNQITTLLINCKIQLQKHKANLIQTTSNYVQWKHSWHTIWLKLSRRESTRSKSIRTSSLHTPTLSRLRKSQWSPSPRRRLPSKSRLPSEECLLPQARLVIPSLDQLDLWLCDKTATCLNLTITCNNMTKQTQIPLFLLSFPSLYTYIYTPIIPSFFHSVSISSLKIH